jgi:hypothetical protein
VRLFGPARWREEALCLGKPKTEPPHVRGLPGISNLIADATPARFIVLIAREPPC